MANKILKWKLMDLVKTIVATLLNKYDYFMVIEGGTGIGKSTLAFQIAVRVAKEFRKLFSLDHDLIEYYYERVGRKMKFTEEEFVQKILDLKNESAYVFNPISALIYTQDELQRKLSSWHTISIPDEMINITFNRDFFSEKQKDIIKMLNMFRDHENLTIACVPQFQNLDNQIKNLTKMKITVKRRGIAIIHTPNSVVYCRDKWDQATNEKIERDWIMKKINKPNYSKLTTFRGLVRFPALTKRQEIIYQKIKNEKRAVVLKEDMGIENTDDKKEDPIQKIVDLLLNEGIKNGQMIDGYAMGLGLTPPQLRSKIVKELNKMNKPTAISYYYWDQKAKRKKEVINFEGI